MSLINLDLLFNAITEIANPLIKEKVQRNETVIKLLKQFDLDPEHPPADFSGVYAYALVEYGVGKPKPVLELFRQEEIKKAFRQAFDRNNASILLSKVDDFIDTYALGDEIKDLRIDIRREIAAFYIIFSEVAKRTRNPADTMMSQQIGSLHRRIANIQEQLNRLPTLEGIRTEIARLALPENNVETRHVASNSNKTELACWQSCLDESASPVEYTWSGYFSHQLDETGRSIGIKPLKKFTRESLEKLRETFGRLLRRCP